MAGKSYLHGSKDVWEEVFSEVDTEYSESAKIQNQLFDLVKLSRMEEIFPNPRGRKILEVGCGAANASLYFAKRKAEVTALDINEPVLAIARQNFKKAKVEGKFVVGDAEKLPFGDGEFDIVMSHGLMEHFKHPEVSFGEQMRVLKPGGILFADIVPARFSVQTFGNYFNFMTTFLYWLAKLKPGRGWEKARRNVRPLYYENDYSAKRYEEMLEELGVKKLKVRGNRPFPRLSLPGSLDRVYTRILKLFLPLWKKFDKWDSSLARVWGAGWWFWGTK